MKIISYGQHSEDILLWRALSNVQHGFYIDVGANDPLFDSVTKLFYDNNWCGINIEPLEDWHELLVNKRPRDLNLKLCVGSKPGTQVFYKIVKAEGLSTLDGDIAKSHRDNHGFEIQELQIQVRPLNDIIDQYVTGVIHFLKIDTEGTEHDVLKSIDLGTHRPWIIIVESTYPGSTQPTYQQWEHILLNCQYEYVFFDGLNRFYVAVEHSNALRHHLVVPPNCFDDYVRYREHSLNHRIQEMEELLKRILGN